MPNRSTFSRDLQANETVADWLADLGISPGSYQPVDATLTALAAYNTNGLLAQTAADTFSGRSIAVSGTGLGVSNADGVSGNPTITLDPTAAVAAGFVAAAQSDQETGTSTILPVTPGRQQFHASAAKCWAYVTVTTGTPAIAASYNITSITDTGVGILTITIATDFSSANWTALISTERSSTSGAEAVTLVAQVRFGTIAAGSVGFDARDVSGSSAPADPASWHFVGFGDQ